MHQALISSVVFPAVILLAVLSGSSGYSGPQPTNSLFDEEPVTQNRPQSGYLLDDIEEDKRGWRDLQGGWGKRAWKDLHNGGWGKRSWNDLQSSWGKRGWQDLQGSWGKRNWNEFHGLSGKPNNFYSYENYEDDIEDPENYSESVEEELENLLQEAKRSWNRLRANGANVLPARKTKKKSKKDPKWDKLHGIWGK